MSESARTYRSISRWLGGHALAASLIVFVCASSVRLFTALRADTNELRLFYPDSTTYLVPAANVIHKGAFLDAAGNPMVNRTPGYPAFLALLTAFIGEDLHRILMLQALLLALTAPIFYWLANRVLPPFMA